MSEQRVKLSINDGIATVTLNRPDKLNALDMAMFHAIDKTIKQLAKNRDVRVVIVTGEGPDFCSGLDLKGVLANQANGAKLLWKLLPWKANLAQRVTIGWRELPVPVIMAIHGRCWGGGMQIALGGDFRIAAKDSSLSVMEGKWGLIPDMGGNVALRELMPKDVGLRLSMLAEEFTADEAAKLNLITETADDPLKASHELAEAIKQRSPDAVSGLKSLYRKCWLGTDGAMLAKETWHQIRILLGKNQKIAVKRQTKDPEKAWQPRKNW